MCSRVPPTVHPASRRAEDADAVAEFNTGLTADGGQVDLEEIGCDEDKGRHQRNRYDIVGADSLFLRVHGVYLPVLCDLLLH